MGVRNKEQIITTISKLRSKLTARYSLRRIGLYGSVAKGTDRGNSDIDIMLDFHPGSKYIFYCNAIDMLLRETFPCEVIHTYVWEVFCEDFPEPNELIWIE